MKERFALIRSYADGTFEFVPGKDGADEDIPLEKDEEYSAFYDTKNKLIDLNLNHLIKEIVLFFD